jgi:hypothetical protein
MAQVALAYDSIAGQPVGRYSAVTQRWFECWAAGCVLVGRAPRTEEFAELAPWEDAHIEVPEDLEALPAFLADLMADAPRLARASAEAASQTRARHDWRMRFAPVLAECGVFPTKALA